MGRTKKAALDVEAIQKRQGIEYRWTRCIARDPTNYFTMCAGFAQVRREGVGAEIVI